MIDDDKYVELIRVILPKEEADRAVESKAMIAVAKNIPVVGAFAGAIADGAEAAQDATRRQAIAELLSHLLIKTENNEEAVQALARQVESKALTAESMIEVIDALKGEIGTLKDALAKLGEHQASADMKACRIQVDDETAKLIFYLAETVDMDNGANALINLQRIADDLGMDLLDAADALDDAKKLGYVAGRNKGQYQTRNALVRYRMFEEKQVRDELGLDYDPEKDRAAVLLAICDDQSVENATIHERTGLPVTRVNFAVEALYDQGALVMRKLLFTAPYSFARVSCTAETRRRAKRLRRSVAEQGG